LKGKIQPDLEHPLAALFVEGHVLYSYLRKEVVPRVEDSKVSTKLRFILGLVGNDSEYQRQQAQDAESVAKRRGIELQIFYAGRDAITQSQQLLKVIQSKTTNKADALIFEPVSETGLPHVARAAVDAGMHLCVLNLKPEYLTQLRMSSSRIVFCVGADNVEVGRIQGRQLSRLVPRGGEVLLIQGPSDNVAARQRMQGTMETKPPNINFWQLKGRWTEESGYQAVAGFLALSTSHSSNICCILAQNDRMAMGARRAFAERTTGAEQQRWLSLPFMGCDGLPKIGEAWVPVRKLTATVVVPQNAPLAVETFADALAHDKRPPEYSLTTSQSYPDISLLKEGGSG
jgi:ABC-type sugar transport system substrate-binding protein